ncbi:MFS transporter [Wenxinia marina]|uniref:Arabinose efflux permease n=1 Tax=Wenxinia marina DSM 24838 TaxID=1123501 RepID=A0A0D0QCS1_9RHOB|nr:MFS transporter [Wenxinia marina]KIQ70117.1 Arabinose efflux permease [Wenxinia marina DSM 24838]GGL80876.1 MFS transporter [Wenxinia marina]
MSVRLHFRKVLDTLLEPNFGIYILGNAISLIGTWTQRVAAGWLVWQLTGSPAWLGVIAFADLFPAVVIAPFAGVAADRWSRLRIMRLAQALGAVIAGVLAVLYFAGLAGIWVLVGMTLALGLVDAFVQPFRLALVSELVERDRLTSAVAIKSVTFNLARFVGPAVAGLIIATVGVGWAFTVNALSFLALFAALAVVRELRPPPPRPPAQGVFTEAAAGVRYAARTPGLAVVLGLLTATCLLARPVVELLPGWAGRIFGGTATDLAALTSAIGIGAVGGGIWLAGRPSASGLVWIMILCCYGLVASLIVFAMAPGMIVALPLMVVTGFFLVTSAISTQTLIQLNVEDRMRGRVLSVYAMIIKGGPAIGALVMGFAATAAGLRLPLVVAMVLLALATVAAHLGRRRMEGQLERHDGEPRGEGA